MSDVQLAIRGMSCGHCVRAVRDALAELPGVTVAAVDVGSATITVDPAAASASDAIAALHDAGYDAEVCA